LEESVLLQLIKKYGKYLLISEKEYKRSEMWFQKYGNGIVFVARLIPGMRTFISIAGGMFVMDIKQFILYSFLGNLIWVGILAGIGYFLGKNWDSLGPLFSKFQDIVVIIGIGVVGYYIYHKVKKR